jgi:hypothetical protein
MALASYMQRAQLLLNDAGIAVYNPGDLITYINLGRQQIATETECVRDLGTLAITPSTQAYSLSLINIPSGQGYDSVLNIRMASYLASGSNTNAFMTERNWEWFFRYYKSSAVAPATGLATIWSLLGRGTSGTLYFYPVPNGNTTITVDCVILPKALATDADTEALGYPFTDAVPFYAAYYAAFTAGNLDAAKIFWEQYNEYVRIAVEGATSTVLAAATSNATGTRAAKQTQALDGNPGGNS